MLSSRDRFLVLLRAATHDGTLEKLTLGKYRGTDATLKNLYVCPVVLKSGPHLSFVWRHATRDITKNEKPASALATIDSLLGRDFLDAHLFTASQTAQLETQPDATARLRVKSTGAAAPSLSAAASAKTAPRSSPLASRPSPLASSSHDRAKRHLIPADAPWLRALGVTNDRGHPREGMADKFRQIQKFTELLTSLLAEAFPGDQQSAISDQPSAPGDQLADSSSSLVTHHSPLRVLDAGSGKGYLTFALAAFLGDRATIAGIEARPELVALCNRLARESNFTNLIFQSGQIADPQFDIRHSSFAERLDVLIALHACDTATDDALARGIAAGARLLVVAPCCQKELRPQLAAPPVLADALQHGIFQERHAEFVTDALRAQLLEWAGYRTKVFEFISTEHTPKNLMIAAIKSHEPGDSARAARLRAFAAFYGIRSQALARQLAFDLAPS